MSSNTPNSRRARQPDFSPREFRAALGMFATGVTVVTARAADGELVGLTASSFNSVSLDPPLVLWSLARGAGSMPVFANGQHYAINVLAADQQPLAEQFAARDTDRWRGVAFETGASGAPLISGSVAHFECFNRSQYVEGDHVIFVGEVERCGRRASASPLLYHGGRFYTEHPLQADPSAPQPPDDRFVGSYLGYLLGQASHAVYRDFESAIAAQGLTHIAWRVLAVLHDAAQASPTGTAAQASLPGAAAQASLPAAAAQASLPGTAMLPVGQLARDVLAKQPTVTKLVQRMAEDGLVELHADPNDQRRTLVAASASGRRLASTLIAQARQQERALLARWSSGEAEALKRQLQRLVEPGAG